MVGLLLLVALMSSEDTHQAWLEQLREGERLRVENRHSESERAYIVARDQAKKLGANELPMAITLNHMGHLFQILGRLRDAERAYVAALAIVERKLGPASHDTVKLAIDLSSMYLELGKVSHSGKPAETDALFQSVISFCENSFGPNYYLLGYLMDAYSEFLRRADRGADARNAKKRAKAILDGFSKENALGHTVDARAFR